MYLYISRKSRHKNRSRSVRFRAKIKARQRRRVNRMARRRLSGRRVPKAKR